MSNKRDKKQDGYFNSKINRTETMVKSRTIKAALFMLILTMLAVCLGTYICKYKNDTEETDFYTQKSEYPFSRIKYTWKYLDDDKLAKYFDYNSSYDIGEFLISLDNEDLELLLSKDTMLVNTTAIPGKDGHVELPYYQYCLSSYKQPRATNPAFTSPSNKIGYSYIKLEDSISDAYVVYKIEYKIKTGWDNISSRVEYELVQTETSDKSGTLPDGFACLVDYDRDNSTSYDSEDDRGNMRYGTTKSTDEDYSGTSETVNGTTYYKSNNKHIFVYDLYLNSPAYSYFTAFNNVPDDLNARYNTRNYNWIGNGNSDLDGMARESGRIAHKVQVQVNRACCGIKFNKASTAENNKVGNYTLTIRLHRTRLWISYNANGGTVTDTDYKKASDGVITNSAGSTIYRKVQYNDAIADTLHNASTFGLTKTGYSFGGWKQTATSSTIYSESDKTILPSTLEPFVKDVDGSSNYPKYEELFAHWTPNNYTITYKPNGGTGSDQTQTVTYDAEYTRKAANTFSRIGYTFKHWNLAADGSSYYGDAGTKDTWTSASNAIFYAIWTPNKYPVTLNGNGATSTNHTTSVTATYDAAMPAITKPSRVYTVTYDAKGGTCSTANATATYTFNGYYTATSGGTQYYNSSGASARKWDKTSNTTLYAQWTSASVTLPTPTRTGYTFLGWNTKADGTGTSYSAGATYTPTSTHTLYAQWKAHTHTVNFNKGTTTDASTNPINTQSATYDVEYTLPTIGNVLGASYVLDFKANTPSNATGTVSNLQTKLSGNLPFLGWKFTSGLNTSTAIVNGAAANTTTAYKSGLKYKNLTPTDKGTVTATAQWNSVTLNNYASPTLTGWTFQGWFTASTNGTKTTTITVEPATTAFNQTLYAQWKANTYTIKYDANDTATNIYNDTVTTICDNPTSVADTSATYDSPTKLATNSFTKEGYIFKGWSLYKDWKSTDPANRLFASGETLEQNQFIGSQFAGGFTATQGDTITLYAIWEPITYSIAFNSNDDSIGNWNTTDVYYQNTNGKANATKVTIRYDQDFKLAPLGFNRTATSSKPFVLSDTAKTKLTEGYTFIGWSLSSTSIANAKNIWWSPNSTNTTIAVTLDKNTASGTTIVRNLSKTNGATVNLYATWQKDLTLVFNPNTGTYKDVANDINTKQPITLSASIYNSQYTYTFNIDDGTTPAKNNYYTVQTGKIKAYGTSTGTKKASTLVNGENSIFTKFTSDGTNYRFLGWNFSPSQTVPNNQFDVFADGSIKPAYNTRTSNYPIYDDTTLYAIYEPILTVDLKLDRVLGSLNANEVSSLVSKKTSDGKQSIDLTIQSGEQAQYQVVTTGRSSKQLKVEFDSRIIDIYTHGDSNSPWYDELNRLTDLNKNINPLDKIYTTKFFIPKYLGTASSYDTSQYNPDKSNEENEPIWNYIIQFKVYQDSYYYETYKGIKEQVQVTANIHLRNSHTSDDDMKDEEPTDSVLEKLKARLKIKLNF